MGILTKYFRSLFYRFMSKIISVDTANYPRPQQERRAVGDEAAKNSIQTEYKGILFDSMAEARFAVFLDSLGIGWEYHPLAQIMVSSNIAYEVDFLIDVPTIFRRWNNVTGRGEYDYSDKTYVEIKGEMTGRDAVKINRFQMLTQDYPLWVISGVPTAEFFTSKKIASNQCRPPIDKECEPFYTCGKAGNWYDDKMVLSVRETTGEYVIAHDGLSCRVDDMNNIKKKSTRTAGGLKMWNTPAIRHASAFAYKYKF